MYTCTANIQMFTFLCASGHNDVIAVSLTCGGKTNAYQFCKYFWDHDFWSWDFFF